MTRLSPETEQAFEAYVRTAEASMSGTPRLHPKPREITVAAAGAKAMVDVKSGIIHDWAAATLVPGSTPEKVLSILQNYENYKNIYAPDVTESKVLAHEGNRWRVFLQLRGWVLEYQYVPPAATSETKPRAVR
jgi:hypothetical protein